MAHAREQPSLLACPGKRRCVCVPAESALRPPGRRAADRRPIRCCSARCGTGGALLPPSAVISVRRAFLSGWVSLASHVVVAVGARFCSAGRRANAIRSARSSDGGGRDGGPAPRIASRAQARRLIRRIEAVMASWTEVKLSWLLGQR